MHTDEILTAAVEFYGQEPDGLRTMCIAAEAELTARLRYGLTPDDCGGLFTAAAALLALSMCMAAGWQGVEAYTAGEVTVKYAEQGQRLAGCENLRRQAETMIAPYIYDTGFAFRGVDG